MQMPVMREGGFILTSSGNKGTVLHTGPIKSSRPVRRQYGGSVTSGLRVGTGKAGVSVFRLCRLCGRAAQGCLSLALGWVGQGC